MSNHDKEYRPSPSQLGSCQRQLTYWLLGFPQEPVSELSKLRALRGTAIHRAFPEIFESWIATQIGKPGQFENLKGWKIIGHEVSLAVKYGKIETTGTIDLIVELTWSIEKGTVGGDLKELTVWDLKNYARVPSEPYESNRLQVEAYIEAARRKFGDGSRNTSGWCGYILYFPDSGMPEAQRVESRAGILQEADAFFAAVSDAAERREFLPRLDYNDRRCSWCGYYQECWGQLLEESGVQLGAETGTGINAMETGDEILVELLTEQLKVRREKDELIERDKELSAALIKKFVQYGTAAFLLEGVGKASIQKRFSKTGTVFYTIAYRREGAEDGATEV